MTARRFAPALLVALAISGLCTFWLSRRLPRVKAAAAQAGQRYVIAAHDVEAGTVLREEALSVVEWHGPALAAGAFSSSAELTGRVVLYPLAAGQPIIARELANAGEGPGLAYRIPDGFRAVSVKSDEVTGVSGFLLPGARVDALVTNRATEQQGSRTSTLLEGVQVLAAGQKSEPDTDGKPITADVVTLLVTPAEAQRLVLAMSNGEIHFALRNAEDRTHTDVVKPAPYASRAAAHRSTPAPASESYRVEMVNGDKQHVETFEWKLLPLRCPYPVHAALLLTVLVIARSSDAQTRLVLPQGAATMAGTSAATPAADVSGFTQRSSAVATLQITSGQSIFIDTRVRLRRVYIANPAVLDSYMGSPNQVVITAKLPGVSSLILWDEKGASQAYQVSSNVDVQALTTAMRQAFPKEDVQVASSEGRVMLSGVVGTAEVAEAAVKLAGIYAKEVSNALRVDRSRIKQVTLKVRIVEVDRSKLFQFGFNFFSQGGSTIAEHNDFAIPVEPGVRARNRRGPPPRLRRRTLLNFLLFSSKLNIGASMKDMENKQLLQILAEPTITSLTGQKANFLAGGEFPFPVVQGGGGAGSQTSISIAFRPYGVRLEFTPNVNA